MKKQYIIPTLDVIKIQPYVLQSGSPNPINQNAEEDDNGNYKDPLSRFFDWDEGDDEE